MQDKNVSKTTIQSIGEFGLIDRIQQKFKTSHATTIKGIGDDAAVIDCGKDLMVLTTDMLTEGIHFDLNYFPLKHLGYKAVAVNISDVAAMNALPEQITVSLGLTSIFTVEAVEAIYEGVRLACENYNVDLIGGDTTSSAAGLVISVTATGRVSKEEISYRSGAQEGDVVCVTGDLGGAYMGLQILEREKQVLKEDMNMEPLLEGNEYLIERILKPEARTDVIHAFRELGVVPSSMIDISDGLASEVLHLSKSSGKGFNIYDEFIPVEDQTYERALEFNVAPTTCALNGGEDYELLFTVSQEQWDKKLNKAASITAIGQVVAKEDGNHLLTKNGQKFEMKAQGWVHF